MTSNALVDLKQVDSLPAYACQAPPEMQSHPLAGDVQQEGRIQILGAGRWNLIIVIIKAMTNIQWKGVHVVLPASTLQCADKGMCWDVDFQS